MPGLIEKMMAAQGMSGSESEDYEEPEEQEEEFDDSDFTPQQLDTIETFKQATLAVLYDKDGNTAKNILDTLMAATNKAEAMANLAYDTTELLDEKSKNQLTPEIAPTVAAEVLGEIAEIAQTAEMPVGSRDIAEATKIMLQRYMEENGVPPEEAMAMFQNGDADEIGRAVDQDEREMM